MRTVHHPPFDGIRVLSLTPSLPQTHRSSRQSVTLTACPKARTSHSFLNQAACNGFIERVADTNASFRFRGVLYVFINWYNRTRCTVSLLITKH